MKKIILTLLLLALTACSPGALQIDDAWARPGNQGGNSAVYMTINSPSDDKIVQANSAVAQAIELHLSQMDEGVMKMHHQEFIAIQPGTATELTPGGYHIMLINLNQDLKPGDQFVLTLVFENAGEKTIDVVVREP